MRITPKTEKQIAEEGLLPDGVYDFEVADCKEDVSSKGNDMLVINLRIFDQYGDSKGVITDYLMEKIAYKLRNACAACGLLDRYEGGELHAEDFIGKNGKVKVAVQKDKAGQYPDKNGIKDYVKPATETPRVAAPARVATTTAQDIDDDIPF